MLALAGRDEPRDYVDILFVHERILPLGALCWAAVGKDFGFTPLSLLERLKRRGKYRPEEFARLDLVEPMDLVAAKSMWLTALADADVFARTQSHDEVGSLYWSHASHTFVMLAPHDVTSGSISPHWGAPGGVQPRLPDAESPP